jgi:hypothetical protein
MSPCRRRLGVNVDRNACETAKVTHSCTSRCPDSAARCKKATEPPVSRSRLYLNAMSTNDRIIKSRARVLGIAFDRRESKASPNGVGASVPLSSFIFLVSRTASTRNSAAFQGNVAPARRRVRMRARVTRPRLRFQETEYHGNRGSEQSEAETSI